MAVSFYDENESGKLEIDFFFDVRCPWAYQASLWMKDVQAIFGDDLELRWKFFSLEQINRKDASWNIWEQAPGTDATKSLWSFLVGAAVEDAAGNAALGKYYEALGAAYHEQEKDINDRGVLEAAAAAAGVSADTLASLFDGDYKSGQERLKAYHSEAVDRYNAFGVPTIVFEEKYAVYVKINPRPRSDRAMEVFQRIMLTAMVDKNVYEIKKPLTQAMDNQIKSDFAALKAANQA
jgi:predicted DsbA family dithiol-disulfide isomerase